MNIRYASAATLVIYKIGDSIYRCNSTYNVFFSNKAGDSCCCKLPCCNTYDRYQQYREGSCNGCQYGSILHSFFNFFKIPVECLHDLDYGVADKDNGTCLNDICFTTLQHGLKCKEQAGCFVFGKLYYKETLSVFHTGDSLDKQRAEKYQHLPSI